MGRCTCHAWSFGSFTAVRVFFLFCVGNLLATLPPKMQRGKQAEVKQAQSSTQPPREVSPVGLRVLVVDDDPDSLRVVEEKLTSYKYKELDLLIPLSWVFAFGFSF
ncbi:hypothetical protein ACLOJK_032856 [Asimina triloba]